MSEMGHRQQNPAISAKPSEKANSTSFFLGDIFRKNYSVDHKKSQVKKSVHPTQFYAVVVWRDHI
ncbi:hypothetical protein SAMN05444141_101239 [Pseudovibrio denitrificans]|uniref:Uncharacterized protein n=1 Tax=Pseudovibrio denitrificans TaxID=258256 RepID=A0A1I6XJ33_9HYPH|nr:hypothetical protein SAMN05444141_101239 [Pseudovibrio denitrificans]